ncbi:putative COP9 signalosome subunit 1, partial [Xylona heveae TC161]
LDLEAYIANYEGRTRFERLLHIGRTSSYLHQEALKGAVSEAKQGKDVGRYQIAVQFLQQYSPNDPDAVLDTAWIETMSKQIKAETDRLEFQLRGYKNNLIKESIRMGNEDLGNYYHSVGELPAAFKAYSRMRDYCTTPRHIFDMCMRLVMVAIEQGNWMAVQSNIMKIRNIQQKPEEEAKLQPFLYASMGLAQLASGNYTEAATSFLQTDPSLGSQFNTVLSSNDIAVYGALCALVSMDRNGLQSKVLESSSFRNFLEIEPHLRRAISFFCNSKYSQCLEILEAYKPDYLLDIYLHRHIAKLYQEVRSKSIVQYFIPFSTVGLSSMANAFVTDEASIAEELVDMIKRGILEARIDTQNRLLTAKATNPRSGVHRSALTMAKNYERTARLRLMRMNMLNAGLEVRAPKAELDYAQLSDVFSRRTGMRPGVSGAGGVRM